jgi:dihydroorotate dehydrogenase electron transfer subunit
MKLAVPEPDLIWLEGRRLLWKFYVLPGRSLLRRLSPGLDFGADGVVCADLSNNLGVVEPSQLLDFLAANSALIDEDQARALAREMPSVLIPFPDFHFKGVVRKNHQFVKDHFSLRIRSGLVPKPAPGQFLQVMCDPAPHAQNPKYRCVSCSRGRWPKLRGIELLDRHPFLRRPFSIASYGPPSPRRSLEDTRRLGAGWMHLVNWVESEFEIIYRRLPGGSGTEALARYATDDTIDVVGPLGKGFTIAPLPEVALLVGGGIGAPPLLFLAEELVRNGVKVKIFLGAITKSRIPFRSRGEPEHRIARFERMGLSPVVRTDDGSAGRPGLVTEALVEYLEKEWKASTATKIFACGPRSMLAALSGVANRYDLPCEVLLEERMACGFGACISCVCAVKEPGQRARFTRICSEGPAFDVRTVMWHA